MKKSLLTLTLLVANLMLAQESLYVAAENGLILRDAADRQANRIGKLDYTQKIKVLERGEEAFFIVDGQDSIRGRWYKVAALTSKSNALSGYVFSGYLSQEKLKNKKTRTLKTEDYQFKISRSNRTAFEMLKSNSAFKYSWQSKEDCIAQGLVKIISDKEISVKLKDGSYFDVKSHDDEQFFGYTFKKYDALRGLYVVYESWLEAGNHIIINAENGQILPLYGTEMVTSSDPNRFASHQLDIGAGWTPNGIQVFEFQNDNLMELFSFDPMNQLDERWGPIDVKWIDSSSLLAKCAMNTVDGGFLVFYKKIEFQKTK